jgi:hypothetical protein
VKMRRAVEVEGTYQIDQVEQKRMRKWMRGEEDDNEEGIGASVLSC